MGDDGAEEDIKKKERERWGGYAQALLIAVPIMLAATGVGFSEDMLKYAALSRLSIISGLIAIVLVVFWNMQELKWRPCGKPILLLLASLAFGVQIGFLIAIFVAGLPCFTEGDSTVIGLVAP